MAEKRAPSICYDLRREPGQYPKLYVRLFAATKTPVQKKIDGAVDNADGYGSADTARRVHETYTALRAAGHRFFWDDVSSFSERWISIQIPRQEWIPSSDLRGALPGYCEPHIGLPTQGIHKIGRSFDLLEKIVARAAKRSESVSERMVMDDPAFFLAALDRQKMVRVVRWEGPGTDRLLPIFVADPARRRRLVTENWLAVLEGPARPYR